MRQIKFRGINLIVRVALGAAIAIAATNLAASEWQERVRFTHLSPSDGLSHVLVDALDQDERGFIWIGTRDGLDRYDGYEVVNYLHDPDEPGSIPPGQVMDVLVARDGAIWVAADQLGRLDPSTGKFSRYAPDPETEGALNGKPLTLLEDALGDLWVGTWDAGLFRLRHGSDFFERFANDPADPGSLPAGPVRTLYQDRAGDLWVGTYQWNTEADLARFDRATESFRRVFSCEDERHYCAAPEEESDRPEMTGIAGLLEGRNGAFWIGGDGLLRWDRERNTIRRYDDSVLPDGAPSINNPTGDLVEDETGRIWFADTFEGLHALDPVSETFRHYRNDPLDPDSLAGDDLFTLFEDRDGLIWVATYFDGLSRFDPATIPMGHRRLPAAEGDSVATARVQGMDEGDDGTLWLYTDHLTQVDPDQGVLEVFPRHDFSGDAGDIEVAGATVWMRMTGALARFEPGERTWSLREFPHEDDSQPDYPVSSLAVGQNGNVWLGTNAAVIRFDPEADEFEVIDPGMSKGLAHSRLLYVCAAGNGNAAWLTGALDGVARLDMESGAIEPLDAWSETAALASEPTASTCHTASDGATWFGLRAGVARYDPRETRIDVFRNNEMDDHVVSGIAEDETGTLWLATWGRGLFRFDPGTREWSRFDRVDGLQGDFVNRAQRLRDGRIVVAGEDGLNLFDPDRVRHARTGLDPVITDIRVLNRSVEVAAGSSPFSAPTGLDSGGTLDLGHEDYLVSLGFSAMDYRDPMAVEYAYRLDGFDSAWIQTDARNRVATYTNLPPGSYTLRVRARHPGLAWSDSLADLGLVVSPPPWRTWWAYLAYALATLALLYVGLSWRTSMLRTQARDLRRTVEQRTRTILEEREIIREQAQRLEELLESKERLFANISHEFRTPLTLILGLARRLATDERDAESREQLGVVRRNGERLLELVDQLLELARLQDPDSAHPSPQCLSRTVHPIVSAFRVHAEDRRISLEEDIEEGVWVACAPKAVERIVMNLLSNALKYTEPGGSVTVQVSRAPSGEGRLAVTDTGIGIAREAQGRVFERFYRAEDLGETVPGSGIGLALVHELVQAYRGSIELESVPGTGTRVVVILPAPTAGADDPRADDPEGLALVTSPASPSQADDEFREDEHAETVLVVEDNPDMQAYLHDLLRADYRCLVSGDGRRALDLAFDEIPDLVVSDVMMPGMNGFELIEALKKDTRTSHIPVILLTARSDRSSRLRGLGQQADDYLVKPFDDRELLLRIRNQLTARQVLKARYARHIALGDEPVDTMAQRDRAFLSQFETVLEACYSDPDIDLGELASRMALSHRQLQRKLKALTDRTPTEYLRAFRLRHAARMLAEGVPAGQAAVDCGFSSQSYFGSCFKAEFGTTPGQFRDEVSRQ